MVQCIAGWCFLVQYLLFIGGYVRIALALPLTFCLQSDQVIAMQKRRLRLTSTVEIVFTVFISFNLLMQLANYESHKQNMIFNCIIFLTKALMVVAMGLSLRRLREWQQ